MEKLTEDQLTILSKALEVDIELTPDKENENKIRPGFNPPAIISKMFALFVYSGWNVGASLPSYTGVHADVEFWKKHFAEKALVAQVTASQESTPQS